MLLLLSPEGHSLQCWVAHHCLSAAAVVDVAGAQSSLPTYLRGQLPTRGSLQSLLRPFTSHDNESTSSVRPPTQSFEYMLEEQAEWLVLMHARLPSTSSKAVKCSCLYQSTGYVHQNIL